MQYQAQVNDILGEWIKVESKDSKGAAIQALRVTKPLPAFPCTVYVADPNPKLVHDNGMPMVVHAYTIDRAQQGGGS